MQKKIEIQELDCPVDDIDCWERYPRHRWVYDRSRLLDAQNIKWSPYLTDLYQPVENMHLVSRTPVTQNPATIYVQPSNGSQMLTELYIARGEIKLMRHIDPNSGQVLNHIIGGVELRLSAFVTLHFVKFTGVITAETHGNDIYRMQLRSWSDLGQEEDSNVIRIAKRIYKKNEITLNGLTDRTLHATLAS